MNTPSGTPLHGDWRRRRGTKTDAHLYASGRTGHTPYDQRPMCGKAIRHYSTERVATGTPCYECLVAAVTAR